VNGSVHLVPTGSWGSGPEGFWVAYPPNVSRLYDLTARGRFLTMIVRQPSRPYRLGEPPPVLSWNTVRWPWGPSQELTEWSEKALRFPLGTIIEETIAGHPAVIQIQTHDKYGAHPDWPAKPHKGTSVFALAAHNDAGQLCAVVDPPDGWGVASNTGTSGDSISGEEGKPAAPKRWNPWVPPGVAWRALTAAKKGHPWLLAGAGTLLGAVTVGTLPAAAVGLVAGWGVNRLLWK
jgi:hypothetical protein